MVAAATASPPSAKPPALVNVSKPTKETRKSSGPDVLSTVMAVLADLSGLDTVNIDIKTELADIGIDSLMGMELASELEGKFKCSLPADQLMEVTTTQTLVQCIQSVLGRAERGESTGSDDEGPSSGSRSSGNLSNSDTSVSSDAKMDIAMYLVNFLGVKESEVLPGTLLRDLGVDPLDKFDVHISDDVPIDEQSVKEMDIKIN